jgi:hypothetical protein
MLQLKDREWKEFSVGAVFKVCNSKPYHKLALTECSNGIPYITRTNIDNGLEATVKNARFVKNPENTVAFGAENATFFAQPFKYITGNKMYFLHNNNMTLNIALFIQTVCNKSVSDAGFGYGKGLTGTRMEKRKILLPTKNNQPDWHFMEQYIKERQAQIKTECQAYYAKKLSSVSYKNILPLEKIKWGDFLLTDIFTIKSGKRLTKADMKLGSKPFIGATDGNNGITAFVSNSNASLDKDILGVNYNGSVVETFYHPYECLFSDDVKRFELKKKNRFVYLFIKQMIVRQKEKFTYGYKFNENRMNKQKIILPRTNNGEPDYAYMEQYVQNIEYRQLTEYLNFIKPA